MEMMWNSLLKLRDLPDDTLVYCGHEYTQANIKFAQTIEPDNKALIARAAQAAQQVAAGKPTVPTTIAEEKAANVFLRADVPAVAAAVGLAGKSAAEVFAEIRTGRISFRSRRHCHHAANADDPDRKHCIHWMRLREHAPEWRADRAQSFARSTYEPSSVITTIRVPAPMMRRHHGADAVRQHGGLVGRRRGLPLGDRLGVDDLQRHALRQLDRDRVALVHAEHHLHLGLQIGGAVADDVLRHRDLVEIFHVHEMEAVAIAVEELVFPVLDVGALDLLGGPVALRGLHAVADAAHVDLRGRRALAGMEVFGAQDDVELVVDLENVAFADGAGDDFHVYPLC